MIAGSVCFTDSVASLNIPVNNSNKGDLICHSVNSRGFRGAFFIHQNTPSVEQDYLFIDEERDIVVLLSGAIYNRNELTKKAFINQQAKDPQLIAELFLQEGPDFVKNLNGDFAISVFNPEKKRLFLFRDHVGICPMAWTTDNETFFFSSDINELCRIFSNGGRIDNDYLLRYFKYIDYRKTPESRVKKLMPGHFLSYSGGGIEIKKYWEPERIRIDRKLSYDSMINELKELVADAVRIRCDERYTAAAHVSSGIDSGIVSAFAREAYGSQGDFYGLSWSPGGEFDLNVKYDERDLVWKSCEKAGIKPLFSEMDLPGFLKYISGYYYNTGYFSEDDTTDRASLLNINLIFSGFGGDEFISIGHSGIDLDLLRGFRFRTFFRRYDIKRPRRFVRYFLFYVVNPFLCILDRNTRKGFSEDARYIQKPYQKSDRDALRNFYCHKSRRQMHLNVFRFQNIPARCESWYALAYRKGIQFRYPLLDRRIIEYILKVPSKLLCKTHYFRPLLREIGKDILPEEVRLNESKNDPLYWKWIDEIFRKAASIFMDETETWKANPDLAFVDFDLLMRDITCFKSQGAIKHEKALFKSLVYLKAIHEFTINYRQKI